MDRPSIVTAVAAGGEALTRAMGPGETEPFRRGISGDGIRSVLRVMAVLLAFAGVFTVASRLTMGDEIELSSSTLGRFSMAGRVVDPRRDVDLELDSSGAFLLTEAEAWAAVQESDYWAHCDNVTYASCDRSTCKVEASLSTASCGCKRVVGQRGSLVVAAKTGFLLSSDVVRKALYEVTVKEQKLAFVNTICGAIADKTLWRSAGLNADYGVAAVDATYPGEWATLDVDCDTSDSKEFNLADCAGCPCDDGVGAADAFDHNYPMTCACPYVSANRSAAVHAAIYDATAMSCDEISAAEHKCALQKTLKNAYAVDSRRGAEALAAALKKTTYAKGGAACPTVSVPSDDDDGAEKPTKGTSSKKNDGGRWAEKGEKNDGNKGSIDPGDSSGRLGGR